MSVETHIARWYAVTFLDMHTHTHGEHTHTHTHQLKEVTTQRRLTKALEWMPNCSQTNTHKALDAIPGASGLPQ